MKIILLSSIFTSQVVSFTHGPTSISFTTSKGPARNYVTHYNDGNQKSSLSSLWNVPPPAETDLSTEDKKSAADRQAPPKNFFELQQNSVKATKYAIEDGFKLIEIEFPPLPQQVLEMDDVSAYDLAIANLRLATDFAKSFAQADFNVAILLPDEAERDIVADKAGNADPLNPAKNVVISSLRRTEEGDMRDLKTEQVFLGLFGNKPGTIKALPDTKMYIILVASAQELPDVEELSLADPDAIIVLFNLKLDTLRGDLGSPAFPRKEFQDRFLSRVKPAYYLRTRQYSRSTPNPPFLVNYQGCLFRSYPGQYQTLLDTGVPGQPYRRVLGSDIRPSLGEFKEQLTKALQVDGVIQEEKGLLSFLRTGYKTTTWWEEERENASDIWKT